MTDIEVLHTRVTDHAFCAEDSAHDMRIKIGFRFPEDSNQNLECLVRVRLMSDGSLPQQHLFRHGCIKAVQKLRRYFAAEDVPSGNIFAV